MSRGIFSLSEYRKEQLQGNISKVNRENYREFGYFLSFTATERLDFSSDTQTVKQRTSLTTNIEVAAAVGNNNYGYAVGGVGGVGPTVSLSTIQRFDYQSDTTASISRGNLSSPRHYMLGTGNANYGYFAGGRDTSVSPNVERSTIDRIQYSSDTSTANIRGPLTTTRVQASGCANMTYAWFAGGATSPAAISRVDRIDFFNDTTTTSTRTALPAVRARISSTGNENFGYWGAGGLPESSRVDRIDLSNDTSISTRGPLTVARMAAGATGNTNFGYFGGGYITNAPSVIYHSLIERVDYANDTPVATSRSSLLSSRGFATGLSSRNFGGSNSSVLSSYYTFPVLSNNAYFASINRTIYCIDFANDTALASARGSTENPKNTAASFSNQDYGYFGGAYAGGSPISRSFVDRLDYSNDSEITLTRGPLTQEKYYPTGYGNKNFGYAAGGIAIGLGAVSTNDRVDYSSDTSTAVAKGPLLSTLYGACGSSSSLYGYIVGGRGPTSTIQRLDYASDTTATVSRGSLANYNFYMGSGSSSSFGWFFGGYGAPAPRSWVHRMDYTNDTNTARLRGPLTSARGYNHENGTGSPYYGYVGGGFAGPAIGPVSTVERVDYSNDTVVTTTRGPLPIAVSGNPGISPFDFGGASLYFNDPYPKEYKEENTQKVLESYGYLGGGINPAGAGTVATIGRIDYSNDTSTTRAKGPLTVERRQAAATGTSSYGYWSGGLSPGPSTLTSINRLDLSNDSTSSIIKGALFDSVYIHASTKNNNYGYFAGGFSPGNASIVQRIDFFNDNAVTITRGPLSVARWKLGGSGNINYGWFGSGGSPGYSPVFSTVDRIDYSNDSVTAVTRGPLTSARAYLESTGNSNYGWYCGGRNASTVFSVVDRIDFANDTATASVRGPLTETKFGMGATTNAANS